MLRPTLIMILACALGTSFAAAQTDVKAKVCISVGSGVSGASFHGKSATKVKIRDFTFLLSDGAGVNLSGIDLRGAPPNNSQAFGDWDVDDNESGSSQENAGEKNNDDSSPGKKMRIDDRGAGGETDDETAAGKPIASGDEFQLFIYFSGNTTGAGELCITPTDSVGMQICGLSSGMQSGNNIFLVDNPSAIQPGFAFAEVNNTGGALGLLNFTSTGDYQFAQIIEFDPVTEAALQTHSCSNGNTCTLNFSAPIPAGRSMRIDVVFNHMGTGNSTLVTIAAPLATGVPALGRAGAAVLILFLLLSTWLMTRRMKASA
jgi:hypothetical protein